MPLATIIVPTHAHRPQLVHSLRSALAQTVADLEVVVIGDGCPDSTRETVQRVMDTDDRVSFVDGPKGDRHGEARRAEVLDRVTSRLVTYLSDDDLLFPDHVATVAAAMHADGANFAWALPLFVGADGLPVLYDGDLRSRWWRERLLRERVNFVPLAGTTHTMALYRSLDEGWAPGPPDLWSDLHMWRKFIDHPDFVATSTPYPTAIIFPNPFRTDLSVDKREAEIAEAAGSLDDPRVRAERERAALRHVHAAATDRVERLVELDRALVAAERARADAVGREDRAGRERDRARAERDRALAERDRLAADQAVLEATLTWRLRRRVIETSAVRRVQPALRRLASRRRRP